jgi:hypothetical protein
VSAHLHSAHVRAYARARLGVPDILDDAFRYVPSAETDLRKTFARIRREFNKAAPVAATKGM